MKKYGLQAVTIFKTSPMLKNSLVTLLLRISGAGLLFVFNLLAVRLLGVSDSGVFFLGLTLLNVFSTFALLGVDQFVLRSVSAEKISLHKATYFRRGLLVTVVSSLATALIMAGLSPLLANLFDSPSLRNILLIFSISLPFLTTMTYLGYAVQAKRKFAKAVFILTNGYYLFSAVFFLFVRTIGSQNLTTLSNAFLGSTIISFVISYCVAFKLYPKLPNHMETNASLNQVPGPVSLARKSHHLFIVSIISLGLGWTDILLVGYYLSDSEVSIYSVAAKLAKLLTFVLFAINIVMAPAVAKYYHEGDKERLNLEVQKSTLLSILFCAPLLVLFLVFPGFFLGLFGSEYVVGSSALRILSAGQAINAFTGAVLIVMTMVGLEKKMNLFSILSLAAVMLLGVLLTPRMGIEGTAIATFVGLCTVNLSGIFYLRSRHGIQIVPGMKLYRHLRQAYAKSSSR